MDTVSFGYARRRRFRPSTGNPFSSRWVDKEGVYRVSDGRPTVGDRVRIVRSGVNIAFGNIPMGLKGVVIADDSHIPGEQLVFNIKLDTRISTLWVEADSIELI